ncbi:TolC family protein [Sulfurimonas sp. SAG-AH-194-C20]|nr:TolC family protein [Sulfurimonas sp. SAG-AH-194-C20]MDF1878992.1 TolC family protein [Sulfurimonas sp. SAG-AH-194-C20]
MKVLKLSLPLFLACSLSLSANENNASLDAYISDLKQEQFKYDYEKNEAESSKLRDSWIAPLQLNYSYTKSKPYTDELTNQNAAIKMDQPIFQSGGIIYGIKFAHASKLYSDYSIDVAKRKMIKDTISILMQIKQTILKIKAQELQIKNSEINLEQKKEQYLSGQLDSGFLDNAIIQRNIVIQAFYDIQTAKQKLITQFESLSDLEYNKVTIPHLEYISSEDFIKYNLVLKKSAAEVQKNDYYTNVTIAKYLPKVSFTAGYNWSQSEQQFDANLAPFINDLAYYDYGLRASMPLDINTFVDIESSRVDYLKSRVAQEDKKRELKALFEQVLHNIENYDKKIALSNENRDIYSKLLNETKELFVAGYKTQYDVDTLQNSLKIQEIDSKVYEIDKQLELLTLYEMYVNNGE